MHEYAHIDSIFVYNMEFIYIEKPYNIYIEYIWCMLEVYITFNFFQVPKFRSFFVVVR